MARDDLPRREKDFYPSPEVVVPVLYGDLDTNGHVNNVIMGRFFENGRVLAHRDLAIHDDDGNRMRFLVARVEIDYLSEGHFGHDMVVKSRIAEVGGSSMLMQQACWQEDRCVAVCDTVMVRIVDGRPTRIPDAVRARFS